MEKVNDNTYNFIFIDSLNKAHIDTEALRELRQRYQGSAFITVSQSTKDGKMRGSLEIVHDCDVAIEIKNRLVALVHHVNVGRIVFTKEHLDYNTEEPADLGHDCPRRLTCSVFCAAEPKTGVANRT